MKTIGDIPIWPFDNAECVKCGGNGKPHRYGADTALYVRGHGGSLIDVTQFGGPSVPEHLIRRCSDCGYEWITETKDAA